VLTKTVSQLVDLPRGQHCRFVLYRAHRAPLAGIVADGDVDAQIAACCLAEICGVGNPGFRFVTFL
jgi:hypothetical protein